MHLILEAELPDSPQNFWPGVDVLRTGENERHNELSFVSQESQCIKQS